jgi:hypothetical protein
MSNTVSDIEQATRNWLEHLVIGFNFCPFARRVWLQNKVAYRVCVSEDWEMLLQQLVAACRELDQQPDLETTLLVLPQGVDDFEAYLELLDLAEVLLENLGYTGIYQLASFHPRYVFGGSQAQDPSNYTNRSPYPMLHLLREESIERALEHYEDPEGIPARNIALANSKPLATWQALLAACYPNNN